VGADLALLQANGDPGTSLPTLGYTTHVDVTFDDSLVDPEVVDGDMATTGFLFEAAGPAGSPLFEISDAMRVVSRVGDPDAESGSVMIYCKQVGGVAQLFARSSNAVVRQVTGGGAPFYDTVIDFDLLRGPGAVFSDVDFGVLGQNTLIRLGSNNDSNIIDGIEDGIDGKLLTIAGDDPITFAIRPQSQSVSAGSNQIITPGDEEYIAVQNAALTLRYDGDSLKWVWMSSTPGFTVVP
jgi:hypothetical protein